MALPKNTLIPALVTGALMLAPASHAGSARDVAKRVTPSVVLLVMQDDNGQPLSMGSGFVVREGVIVTNLHVVSGAARGYAKLAGEKDKLLIDGTVGIDGAHDLAILSVPTAKAPPLPLGKSSHAAAGDEVYAIGNPQGLEGTFSAGIISGVRKIGADTIIQITAPISPGSSGGPVTNTKGEVIGVSVATFKGGQNLNFAIPSAYIELLLAKPTPVTTLAKATKAQPAKAQSILDGLGGKSTAGVEGASFTWDDSIGSYSFSFKSQLQTDVRDVVCLVVFHDAAGSPIDVDLVQFPGVLPAGLAKRLTSRVDGSVLRLNTQGNGIRDKQPKGRIEFRILYFQVGDVDQPAGDEEVPARSREGAAQPRSRLSPERQRDLQWEQDAIGAQLEEVEAKLADAAAQLAPAGDGPDLIESRIEGDFEGWTGETIFKLDNGQIWQQIGFDHTYRYAFRPKVMIVKTKGTYKMKVDGVDRTIFVKRIK
jgi:hypothetical protein